MTNSRLMLLTVIILTGVCTLRAQVSIGTKGDPPKAALLQLKTQEANNPSSTIDDANITSQKGGLLLPRVKLKNQNTLEPFIATNDADWQNNQSTKIKELHAGLAVYNLTTNGSFTQGIYIWDGSEWSQSKATVVEASNGLTLKGNEISLGGTLADSTAINQNGYDMNFTGSGNFNILTAAVFNNDIKIPKDAGDQKLLMSDNNGNASWIDPSTLPSTLPTAMFSKDGASATVRDIAHSYRSTETYIELPPGRWILMVTMWMSLEANDKDDAYWVRSTFIKDGENEPDDAYFVGSNKLISGRVTDVDNNMSGYVVMQNNTNSSIKFVYHVGRCEGIYPWADMNSRIKDFGKLADGNSIIAFPLVEP